MCDSNGGASGWDLSLKVGLHCGSRDSTVGLASGGRDAVRTLGCVHR